MAIPLIRKREQFARLSAGDKSLLERIAAERARGDFADATGHVNRTLQDLRAAGLIVLKGETLTIPDLKGLMRVALFNPNDLHLDREGHHRDANETEVRHLTMVPLNDLRREAECVRSCAHHESIPGG
ncbi:hypothetical protein [Microvirga yunnanensis]|uniref:hypothetical protein n=1 Tax=Microvirga yunnanensis TaxID=2953740 RepID=UPI00358DC2D9